MRLTNSLNEFIYRNVNTYSKQIGIEKNLNLILTRKEVLSIPETVGRRNTRRYLGVCYRKHDLIFLNVKHHKSRKQLRHTIVHELVHYRFKYLAHGKNYENRINLILKGKKYKVKDK